MPRHRRIRKRGAAIGGDRAAQRVLEGAAFYYFDHPKNKVNDWFVAEHRKRFGGPPDAGTSAALTSDA